MAVDKGSLDYKIRVTDAFSKPIAKFRSDLLKARNTAQFVKQEIKGATSAITALGVASARAGSQTKKLTREELAHWKAVRDGAKTATTAERLRARARRDNVQESVRLAKQAATEAKREATLAREAAAARKRASVAAAAAAARAVREQKRLNRQLATTQRRGNGLVLTFKRLAGVFIGFQAIRFGAEAIRESIAAGLRFNSIMEDSRIGVAAIIATLADVTNEEGQMVKGADAFQQSLLLADSTLEKIRRRSLATTATFPQLIEAFQAGVAPGLEAGLSLDEIVTVTERVSQAAAGLRIQQNQLNEEIRSLLRGTAQARTSLVATILFGGAENANKRIKEAREVGNVFEVINERLHILGIAADATQKTFSGTFARLKGALEFTAGQGSLVFFAQLKDLMNQVSDVFVTTTRTASGFIDNVTPKESTIVLLARMFATLTNITKQVQTFLASLTQNEVAFFVATLGAAVEIMGALILGALKGVIAAVALVGRLFQAFGFALGGLNLGGLTQMTALLTSIAVIAVIIKTTIAAWAVVLRIAAISALPVFHVFKNILTVSGFILTNIGKIPPGIFTAIGAVALLGLAFFKILESILQIELDLADLPEAIGLLIEQISTKTLGLARVIGSQIKNAIIIIFLEVSNALKDFFEDVNEELSVFRGDAGAQELVKANEIAKVQRLTELTNVRKQAELRIKEIKAEARQIDADADAKAGARVAKLETEVKARQEMAAAAKKAAEEFANANFKAGSLLETITTPLNDLFGGVLGDDIVDVDGIVAAIKSAIEKGLRDAKPPPTPELDGYTQTIIKGFKQMGNEYANTLAIMKGLTSQFANFASTEIAIALDPNEDPDGPSANERFKTFLDQIGKMIIQKLVELAIAKSILFIAGAESGGQISGAAFGGQIGFDEGGTVPGGKHEAKTFRPAAVAMSDTVPAWLTPGEFVNPVKSVMKYGADLFEGLRTGALDPAALREAAGLTNHRKSVKKVRAKGFAEGGPIAGAAAEGRSAIQAQQNSEVDRRGVSAAPALMVSDDQSMDRLMAGGERQFRNWADNNKEFFRGIVKE